MPDPELATRAPLPHDPRAPSPHDPRAPSRGLPALTMLLTTVVVGVLAGLLWARLTPLPGYTVQSDGGASTTERGLTGFIHADIVFAGLGLVLGIGLGIVGWRAFGRRLGWLSVPVMIVMALLAAVLCWQVGELIGPTDFDARLAAAAPGQTVPIDLELRARTAIAAWVLGACAALMVLTALVRDPDDGEPLRLPWTVLDDRPDR